MRARNQIGAGVLLLACCLLGTVQGGQGEEEEQPVAGDIVGGCASRAISAGVAITGTLGPSDCLSVDGPFYTHVYSFDGLTGQRISISLSSSSFDTYLVLLGPDGSVVAQDDDGGGGLNARIPMAGTLRLEASGAYRIEVSSFQQLQTGNYTLLMESIAPVFVPGAQSAGPFRFVPVTPCRLVDTRPEGGKAGSFGPPFVPGGGVRVVPVALGSCDIPATATAFSMNITVIPRGSLAYLIAYPTGQTRPNASTLNSFEGRVVANAAMVPAGIGGSISIFVTNDTDVVVDINGYLAP